jgi:predicted dehydrogenase
MSIAAAQHGKHVWCDKPMATSVEDAKAMIEAARAADVKLFYGEEERYNPFFLAFKEALDQGAIGRPIVLRMHRGYFQGEHYNNWRWVLDKNKAGGGCLMDAGSHDLYVIRWLMGDVQRVSAEMDTYYYDSECEDSTALLLRFTSGAIGVLVNTWVKHRGFDSQLEIIGTTGDLSATGPQDRALHIFSEEGVPWRPAPAGLCWSVPHSVYRAEFCDVIETLQQGGEPLVSGEDGLYVLQIIEAAYGSSRTGQPVAIPS